MELTAEYIQEKCGSYKPQCKLDGKHLTLTGLALHIGAESVDHMYELMALDEVTARCLKRAILEVENQYELFLSNRDTTTGAQFVLSKMGWRSKESLVTIVNQVGANVNYAELPDDEILRLIQALPKDTPKVLEAEELIIDYEHNK